MMTWRDTIKIHPAADIFPMASNDELLALGEDIRKSGLMHPITIMIDDDDKPVLVDGRGRLDAMERIGWRLAFFKGHRSWVLVVSGNVDEGHHDKYSLETVDYGNAVKEIRDTNPCEYIISANIHRRHLTADTKRGLIAKLLQENPERSNRATAELADVDHKTVAAIRRREEDVGSVPHVEKVIDSKGRTQPTYKPKKLEGPQPKGPRVTKISLARRDGTFGLINGLLLGLEMAKPETISLIIEEIAANADTLRNVKALRDQLGNLLDSATSLAQDRAKKPKAKEAA
jgi:hypothetical protein